MNFDIGSMIQTFIVLLPVIGYQMKINREIGELKTEVKNLKEMFFKKLN